MAEYKWPEEGKRSLIGKRIKRIDGPLKVAGKAKYTYDFNAPGMLFGKILRSPYAHAKIVSIDTSAAERMPGVKAVRRVQDVGAEIQWAGDEVISLCAVDEPTAEDAMRAIKVQYEKLPHFVNEQQLDKIPAANRRPPTEDIKGEPDKAFAASDVIIEDTYGNEVIAHCCLESHGLVALWDDEQNVTIHASTQSVTSNGPELARVLGLPAANVRVRMEYLGGGFGSKFPVDRWGVEAARLSKLVGGKPVKMMLERDAELTVAGTRPSAFARVKVGATKDGKLTAWESESWGSGGVAGAGQPPYPVRLQRRDHQSQNDASQHHDQQRPATRVACAESSAGLFDHDVCA